MFLTINLFNNHFWLRNGHFKTFTSHRFEKHAQLQLPSAIHRHRLFPLFLFDLERDILSFLFVEALFNLSVSDVFAVTTGQRPRVIMMLIDIVRLTIRIGGSWITCSGWQMVSPSITSGIPERLTMSPATASSNSTFLIPRYPSIRVMTWLLLSPWALTRTTGALFLIYHLKTRPVAYDDKLIVVDCHRLEQERAERSS